MDELSSTSAELKTACANHDRDREVEISKLNESEKKLKERMDKLNQMKHEIAEQNGNVDAKDDDIVEINAGGKIIASKRGTLTQLDGTKLAAICSGRWDKKLQRDNGGRIFLDVNSVCFQAIVDYLNELTISSEDNPPKLPHVEDENKHILNCQLDLFGLSDKKSGFCGIDSCIIKDEKHMTLLHDWLKEDGSDGELSLLYRSSRDGRNDSIFHDKCDIKGCTLTVIETTCGRIFGGYSNMPWRSGGAFSKADKAFLFSLCGDSPCKMKLKHANDGFAVTHCNIYGPTFGFGSDLYVKGETVSTKFGHTYESGTSPELSNGTKYTIKDMEVFQVSSGSPSGISVAEPKKKKARTIPNDVEPITRFSDDINKAINIKQACLMRAELELSHLENSFKDEVTFIDEFSGGDSNKDVVTLNVSGTIMVTKRSTLCIADDSVLAQQFDDSKWTEQGYNTPRVKEWTPDDVYAWAKKIDDISDEVANNFVENDISGNQLLALEKEGLVELGITKTGIWSLLLKEIKKLEKASQDVSTLIEHGPYCFGKILDHLRLKQLHSQGTIEEEPALPVVCDSQKDRFEKVVKYYFPGDSSKFILG